MVVELEDKDKLETKRGQLRTHLGSLKLVRPRLRKDRERERERKMGGREGGKVKREREIENYRDEHITHTDRPCYSKLGVLGLIIIHAKINQLH